MKLLVFSFTLLHIWVEILCSIKSSLFYNKLSKVKPVGGMVDKNFVPLTEIPPPRGAKEHHSGRRHMDDCHPKVEKPDVYEGGKIDIFGEYYDDRVAKTVATVIIPDHIDHKHFQVTTSVPYFTLGPIEGLGYHPSTLKSEHPSECEKIYQDHLDDQYSDEDPDFSEESLEMARLPLFPDMNPPRSMEQKMDRMYSDLDI